MPADLLRKPNGDFRIDLDRCYTPFVEKAVNVLAACRKRGQDYMPTFGWRSFEQQARLYFQGRTLPGAIVTNARPGESAHNFGLAWDLAADGDKDKGGLQPTYDPKRYAILGEECERAGLVWGGRFTAVDMPHIQWPGFVNAKQLSVLQKIWKDCPDHATEGQRLSAVWQYCDALRGVA
jgi:peptidoglycan L-alanyl-D-glutamate endopeptidase CwlK